jgi:hypothetical protein
MFKYYLELVMGSYSITRFKIPNCSAHNRVGKALTVSYLICETEFHTSVPVLLKFLFYLYICVLFNDAVSRSNYMASNNTINE